MNAWDVFASLARRWYLTLAGLVGTAVLVVVALQLVHPSYVSRANVVLLPPESAVESGGNPYLQLGGLVPTLDLLSVSLSDEETKRVVATTSPGTEYEAVGDTTNAGPVLAVTATSSTSTGAVRARDAVVAQVPLRLQSLQVRLGIAERSQITSMVLTQDPVAVPEGKDQVRAALVAAAVGLGATALLVALLDGVLVRRRNRSTAFEGRSPADVDAAVPYVEATQTRVAEVLDPRPTSRGPDAAPVGARAADPASDVHHGAAPGRTASRDQPVLEDASSWSWGDEQEATTSARSGGPKVSSR